MFLKEMTHHLLFLYWDFKKSGADNFPLSLQTLLVSLHTSNGAFRVFGIFAAPSRRRNPVTPSCCSSANPRYDSHAAPSSPPSHHTKSSDPKQVSRRVVTNQNLPMCHRASNISQTIQENPISALFACKFTTETSKSPILAVVSSFRLFN